MFARISTIVLAALAVGAAASAVPRNDGNNQCNTGSEQCCNSTVDPTTPSGNALLGLLGLLGVIGDIPGLVGFQCSPLNVVGGSSTCSQAPVCCQNKAEGGLISIGCIPITL
ncbi:Hydrophobin-3 [Grifola frondosa]|uniref:Hydrophobin n=1 Tax=Grifola frondosa TaxID=5627 RepID=A0A1C7MKA7_GRIFR|nr:Hydrophobin-3 [Grifola frondosa]